MDGLDLGIAGEYYCCYDLAMSGFKAFPSEQGLPFDLVLIKDNKLYKLQVKTTNSLHKNGFYSHNLRSGRGGKRKMYSTDDVDIIAFVNLIEKQVAYMWLKDCKSIMNFYPKERQGMNVKEVQAELKRQAIIDYHKGGKTKAEVCLKFGIPEGALDKRVINKFREPLKYYKDFNIEKLWH